jgi:hypothetical protein
LCYNKKKKKKKGTSKQTNIEELEITRSLNSVAWNQQPKGKALLMHVNELRRLEETIPCGL